MNVSVFGLGYVGSVSAASFAADGHTVVGVDVNPDKVNSLNEGRSPIVEKGLDDLIRENASNGRLRATTSTRDAVESTDLSLICVGTPSRRNGSLDLTYLERVAEQIGEALRDKASYHVVVVRSTVLPGTTHDVVIPALERTSGRKYGSGFGVAVNPEFLREGTAINDFRHPPLTLVGHNYSSDAEPTKALYAKVEASVVTTTIRTAEMIKYASNTWHALKVTFANEVGNLCKRLQIDSHEVMDIFCRDEKLNLSSYYMKPGFAFGGSCLPKDVRAMQYRAKEVDLDMPVIQSILASNRLQIEHAIDEVVQTGKKRVGLLGFSFKAGTDDLRESPIVILAEALLGKGYALRIYDKNVSMARLVGANKEYINTQIPHLSSLLCETIDEVIDGSDVLVVGNAAPEFSDALTRTRAGQIVLDLVRVKTDRGAIPAEYRGICW
ncbi:MAG TPA: UDP-glucose/GDP-mannose dehydrogenase family protein [Vicinamibacterales bacterium]|jgi:GDP-mannose 6-dehydrogenase|nr:UDP-glucose/GDP-mannose dehydrogenase family protein [Vicinamibacterales bacterium]